MCRKNGEKQFEAISCHVRDMSLALATLLSVLPLLLVHYFFLFLFCWLPFRLWPSIDKKVFFRCGKCSAKCKQLRPSKAPQMPLPMSMNSLQMATFLWLLTSTWAKCSGKWANLLASSFLWALLANYTCPCVAKGQTKSQEIQFWT